MSKLYLIVPPSMPSSVSSGLVYWGSGIRVAVFPLEQNFRRHGNAEKIESVVGDLPEHIVHVLGPYPVENLTADIVAEPVAAGDPDRIAVLVYDFGVVVDVQPVVVVAVRLCGGLCREGHRRSRCAGKHGSRQSCRQQQFLKNVMQHKILPVSCACGMLPHLISVLPIL